MLPEVDFLIVYNIKNRELENCCLLKCELERRGYTVKLLNRIATFREDHIQRFRAKVVVYRFSSIQSIASALAMAPTVKKLVSMESEQIYYNSDETDISTEPFFVCPWVGEVYKECPNVVHIVWGKKYGEQLTKFFGANEKNVKVAGHIALDFLRQEFKGFYLTREQLFEKYKIPTSKQAVLFISSFSIDDTPAARSSPSYQEYRKFSEKSQEHIIEWFKRILNQHPEFSFIYRPHPVEADSAALLNMTNEFDNFYVISELSVRQWILTCDNIYTWVSTAIAEIYAANKSCNILRPLCVPPQYEIPTYIGAKNLKTYEQFERSLLSSDSDGFPLDGERLLKYYHIDENEPAYVKICNILEEILNNDEYSFDLISKLPIGSKMRLMIRKNTFVFKIFKKIQRLLDKRYASTFFSANVLEAEKKCLATESEIDEVCRNIKRVLF